MFQVQFGLSPKEFLESVKMNRACEWLSNPKVVLKIYEVAEKLGYSDPYHFIKRFTAFTGFPPGRYRRKYTNQ
ncbi:MAG: helix-turn-helix transcriptional regulator [Lentisphaerae bacterium]|nr:helix-turn-helix transcriptional regulator [Lentisphaerota bacterium]MCP4102116.1 helix-turn-helix transcriptional regulator [Lentisphaerota bacterium]